MGNNKMNEIITKAEKYVKNLYEKSDSKKYTFHNYKHVDRTVNAVKLVADNTGISELDLEILTLAAWFHDIGILELSENHEEKSAEIAKQFLRKHKYPDEKIIKILNCIKATNLSKEPKNIMEQIIRDADVIHLGKKSFFKRNAELRREIQNVNGKVFSDKGWIEFDLRFLNNHKFFTDFAKENFNKRKKKHIEQIQSKLDLIMKKENSGIEPSEKEMQKLAKSYLKTKTPDRGIETMFRLTSKNHFTLSSIADSKAGTLISISAVIISIIISVLIRKLDTNPELILPTVIMLLTLMGTIIFAVLSTRPTVTSLGLTKKEISEKKGNLLYFGNFINMPVQDYEWGMQELMDDRDYLYNNLIRDIYYLGVVLGKKYRYLKYAYNIFMYGLIVSVVAYIIAFAF
jgi:predicted metal-dependent HD superfamily phosphohydrolase